MATKRKSKSNFLKQPVLLAVVIAVAVTLFVTYYATSGQTAKFSAAGNVRCNLVFYQDADKDSYGNIRAQLSACSLPQGYVTNNLDCGDADPQTYPGAKEICGDSRDNNCNGIMDDGCAGRIKGKLRNRCTNSGVATPIYLDGQRVADSDSDGRYEVETAVGKHNFKIQMGNINGLIMYESDRSANYITEINEDVTIDSPGRAITKNYDFETGRGIRLHTNVPDVVVPYIGSGTLDCSKPEGCWLGSAPIGRFSVLVQHADQTKLVDTTVERCTEKDVTVNF